jgi:prephenate dehydratase
LDKKIELIAIQGIEGSFHEWAASLFFRLENPSIFACSTFRQLAKAVATGTAWKGIMAIENTLAGSILPNYALLEEFDLWVSGEIYLPIHQCLMALPGQAVEQLTEVRSHPMALLQCAEYLDQHTWLKPVEHHDTAESAKEISINSLNGVGAIAAERAAAIFRLEVIARNIETHVKNFTRFLVVEKAGNKTAEGSNKAMISMQLADRPGTLWQALDVLKNHSVNMTKIQSLPVIGKPYTYSFHADLEWENGQDIFDIVAALKPVTVSTKLLGAYPKGNRQY